MNRSFYLIDDEMEFTKKQVKALGFKNVNEYVAFAIRLLNGQDRQSLQLLNHYRDCGPGKFLQLLLLDHCAKVLAEGEVCGKPQDQLFYVEPNGKILSGERYFQVRFAKHKRAYRQALTFSKQINAAAGAVAADQALAEVQDSLSKQEVENE